MNQQQEPQVQAEDPEKRGGKPRRTERVESRVDLRHKGMRGKMVAGGLLALVGIAAVFLA